MPKPLSSPTPRFGEKGPGDEGLRFSHPAKISIAMLVNQARHSNGFISLMTLLL